MTAPDSIVEQAEQSGLMHVSDTELPGITRGRQGAGFAYFDPTGDRVTDKAVLRRIKSLAIPPAYKDVWICPFENGHLQASGRDARGRKQYRYHSLWIELSRGNKFGRMLEFGKALPKIRARVDRDLRKRGVPLEKVCATILWLLERSLIRIGNEEYAKSNRSYGLTTLRDRHVSIGSQRMEFKFVGKRGIKHLVSVSDRRMARILGQISDLPGQKLFHYVDESGEVRAVDSSDVNGYLREISGKDFTAKDFRTWAATVLAFTDLSTRQGLSGTRAAKSAVREAISSVAKTLGNTPAIARKSYVHPAVLEAYLDGTPERHPLGKPGSNRAERAVLALLKRAKPTTDLASQLEASIAHAKRAA